ncbi:uncharacterized protein KQ657_002104 [Scheffersomyces spartinae]|uniref:PCI domain-containing protein n=1 Tax=Scheffersomyces spartinae TaxID=45513 RepID=A0A9P8AKB6_9ASCO|nr:uncharacterized protein KQ657_002104 [Scheffersomyces spartinae]KAG7195721.1 hypothetical protein KQ657_002104 [Scheffersomyces spartinae]
MDQYVHTKYTDILQDYTYLPNNEVIELVSRKLTLIPKDSPEDSISQLLVKELALKVATLATIAGGDYRRGGLIRMIRKWRDLLQYLVEWSSIVSNEYICQIISLLIDHSDEILEIEDIDETRLPNWRCLIPQGGITNNFRQVKILVLPRYYLSVYFDRLVKLLGMGEGGAGSVDNRLELLIMDMILRNSLPLGSKIDQKKGVLIFGTLVEPPTGQAQMNNHITQVQQLLTEAVSLIP